MATTKTRGLVKGRQQIAEELRRDRERRRKEAERKERERARARRFQESLENARERARLREAKFGKPRAVVETFPSQTKGIPTLSKKKKKKRSS